MRRSQVVVLLALLAALAGATPVRADPSATPQSSPAPSAAPTPAAAASPVTLPPVVVTATRIEQPLSQVGTTVTVIDDADIQSQKISHVTDVLRQVPGVNVIQTGSPGNVADVSIRGATSAQTLVLLDGVEVNESAGGFFDISGLTTENLDRIEIVRGAGGALYGANAVGGVINVISPEGEGAPKFSLLSDGGNRATTNQVATFNGAFGKLGISSGISYYSTTGFRPINDNSDNLSGNIRLDYHLDADTTVRGFARYTRSNVSLVNFNNFNGSLDPDAHQRNEFMLFKGEIEHRFGQQLDVRASGSFVRSEFRIFDTPDAANPGSERDDIPDEIRGFNLEGVYTWLWSFRTLVSGLRTVAGFDFKDRWVRDGDVSNDGFGDIFSTLFRARRQEYAGYFEQEGTFLDGWLIGTVGFRWDYNSDFGQEPSPAWALVIPFESAGLALRGSYSEGYRAPSFDDLFFPNFGNPNLSPEISSEYDGGVTKAFGELASFTATYFSRRVHDQIVSVAANNFKAENVERVDTQGVELVPQVQPLRGLTLGGNFTAIDETHDSGSSGSRPLRVPKHSGSGLAQYSRSDVFLPDDLAQVSLAYTFVGDRDDVDPTGKIRNNVAYHRFDLTTSYAPAMHFDRIRSEQFFVRIQNLTDRNYAEALGFKSPPINFVAGIKLEL